jgi:hypothetical protein
MDPNEKPLIRFCQLDIRLSQLESFKVSQDQSSGWRSYTVPLSLFNCPPSVIPALNKLDFLVTESLSFCLDDVSLDGGRVKTFANLLSQHMRRRNNPILLLLLDGWLDLRLYLALSLKVES